jgi:pimeloyl-ACP methyl ester carboxylesterase
MSRSARLSVIALIVCAAASTACSATAADPEPETREVRAVRACAPVSAVTETLRVENEHGALEGTLEVPGGCAGMPVLLIISGSGPQDRDGGAPAMYKHLAGDLKAAGFASLRFDDVGVGGSAAAVPPSVEALAALTYEFEIDAARRWIPVLRGDRRFGSIVAAGHSQGALTATLLAQDADGGSDAVISLAGAGRPIDAVLRAQLEPQLPAEVIARLDAALVKLRAGELAGALAPPLDRLLPVAAQRYWMSWMKYDPKVEIGRVTRPALIVQGGTDVQVTAIDAALLREGKADAEYVEISDMCHVLKQAPVASIASQAAQYSDPALPLHADLVPAIAEFLRSVGTGR